MNDVMRVIKCGTFINITVSGIKAMITCVSIRFSDIIYEATYYDAGKHESIWLREAEFTTIEQGENIKKIGFK